MSAPGQAKPERCIWNFTSHIKVFQTLQTMLQLPKPCCPYEGSPQWSLERCGHAAAEYVGGPSEGAMYTPEHMLRLAATWQSRTPEQRGLIAHGWLHVDDFGETKRCFGLGLYLRPERRGRYATVSFETGGSLRRRCLLCGVNARFYDKNVGQTSRMSESSIITV